jgi:SAM-dependent methyltransferase
MNSPAELEEFYSAVFSGSVGKILKESSEAKRKMAEVLLLEVRPWLSTSGRVLDIGAGFGEWLELLHGSGFYDSWYGVEYSSAMANELRTRCPWATITVSSAEQIGSVLQSKNFTLITLIAVIEHLHDPQKVLQYISESLGDGGRAVIVYPRVDSFVSRVMGRHWHLFSPVAHLTLYSRKGLLESMSRVGLELVASRRLRHYYDLAYVCSFMTYFFPWTEPVVSRLSRINWIGKIGFRAYTGIDVVVAKLGDRRTATIGA